MAITDGMGGFFGELGINTKSVGGAVSNFMFYLVIFLIVAGIVGVVLYFAYQKKIYNKKIPKFGVVNGRTTPIGLSVAKEITIPKTTVKVFVIKGGMILPRPTIATGQNNYLHYILNNGEWVNFRMADLNKQLNEMGLDFDHTDMRYAHTSLKNLINENYGEKNFWKEYGAYIALGALVVMVGVSFYLIADKLGDSAQTLADATKIIADTAKQIAEKTATSGIRGV